MDKLLMRLANSIRIQLSRSGITPPDPTILKTWLKESLKNAERDYGFKVIIKQNRFEKLEN